MSQLNNALSYRDNYSYRAVHEGSAAMSSNSYHESLIMSDELSPEKTSADDFQRPVSGTAYTAAIIPRGANSSYHSFTAYLLAFWVVLIAAEVILMERSVALGPTIVHLPWYYSASGLPSVLNTIFAQGHSLVTAMHLSRLIVSGLQSRHGSPRTWIEMFWIANQNWSGPVGIVTTILGMIKLRIRVSSMFMLFSIISIVVLVTPVVLDQAYPVDTLDVEVHRSFNSSMFSSRKLSAIDGYAQMATGKGTWATNRSVLDVFNSTTFTPVDGSRNVNGSDFFFAGDAQGMDVSEIPGIRIRGGCQAVDTTGLPDLGNSTNFFEFCVQQLNSSDHSSPGQGHKTLAASSIALNVSYCIDAQFGSLATPSNNTALVWFANDGQNGMLVGDPVRGLVRCNTSAIMGNASVYGRTLTFDNFQQNDELYDIKNAQAGESIQIPLFAALYALLDGSESSNIVGSQVANALGFTLVTDENHSLSYVPPSTDELANAMWRGATHMAVALAILAADDTTAYPAIEHVSVSGRTRNLPSFIGAMALLVFWLLSMAGLTAALWRETSLGDGFDSYVAARFLANRVDLVDGDCSGGLEENKKLLEQFEAR